MSWVKGRGRGRGWIGWLALLYGLAAWGCGRPAPEASTAEILSVRTVALAYLEENRLEEAEAEFRKLIELVPDEALAYANLGLVYLRMGRYDDAEREIDRALARGPEDADIRLMQAKVFELTGRRDEARSQLERALETSPDHVKTLYSLADLYDDAEDPVARQQRETYLERVVGLAQANIVARLQLIEVVLRNGEPDRALAHWEEIRRQVPEFPGDAPRYFDQAAVSMRASRAADALTPALMFHNFLRLTALYQGGLLDLQGPGGALIGFPVLQFSQNLALRSENARALLEALQFTDVTALAGLDTISGRLERAQADRAVPSLAVADFDADGDPDIYVAGRVFRNEVGRFVEIGIESGVATDAVGAAATFADYDNDGALDLYLAGTGVSRLYRNSGSGGFRDVTSTSGVSAAGGVAAVVWLDIDHDGDLDLFSVNAGPNQLYRNNGDGTFTERAGAMGLDGRARSWDAALGDFDDDDDIDLFVVNQDASNALYSNLRQGRFEDVSAAAGVSGDGQSGAVAAGDYDNDGFLDLFVTALDGGEHALYRNRGDGTFDRDVRSGALVGSLRGVDGLDAEFFDFDNDGWQDLLVAGMGEAGVRTVRLFHNDGTGQFDDVSDRFPDDLMSAGRVAVADFDDDGDVDVLVVGLDGGIRLLRNDGGNANQYLNVQLVGLSTGSGKNNYFGIGAKLEVRAGRLYQMRVVTGPVTHLGLGSHLKADVVRIQWTNGVPQNLFYPGSDQDIVEEQTLKGSCAFLYVWDGQEYTFVTDVMWRSALGMPLGIMGGSTAYAPPHASQEYLRVPGDLLTARDGRYSLRLTEELWEVAYLDEINLLAVDHPDSIDIFVDERFVPPAPAALRIFQVGEERIPSSAVDQSGTDLMPAVRAKDNLYVSNLTPAKFQGITAMHDLILDLGAFDPADRVVLFLNGWIFPTDASINVAVAQSNQVQVVFPYLEMIDSEGRWTTAIPYLGFPSGKNKTVVVDLSGKFPTDDHRVRVRTNMEIYWDHVFFSVNPPSAPVRLTTLEPNAADLNHRGFSRLYRKGGRYGPHWFDYGEVSREARWRPIEGRFTRYGDVLSLLGESDDMYVIMSPGDELRIEFDASDAPTLPPGWTRDFLLYSDGWIKDADLNTAAGNTVQPLPYHAMPRYPYGPNDSYPSDDQHQRYLEEFNTRVLPGGGR